MNEIYQQLLERNARETVPFLPVYEANASLLNLTESLQAKCAASEREVASLSQLLLDAASTTGGGSKGTSTLNNAAMKSALKNEARLRDKLELLQEEFNAKLKVMSDIQADALKTASRLQEVQTLNVSQDKMITALQEEIDQQNIAADRLRHQAEESEASTKLAEQQYDGLKSTIRTLQEENDALTKENRDFESRLITDKTKMVDEMTVLTDMVERLKKEVDMLRSLKQQEDQRSSGTKLSWFGGSTKNEAKSGNTTTDDKDAESTRKFGIFDVAIVPSISKTTIAAHTTEGTCVRYDNSGTNLVATASSDSTVKVWDTASGSLRGTFRGSPGHTIICCDIDGVLVVGAGSDKTCRVWNLRTERMVTSMPSKSVIAQSAFVAHSIVAPPFPHLKQIHQLVGHQHKITCVRLFGGDKGVVTGSADRSLKVWDISRKTYRQTTTLRHSSTSTCVDVASDGVNAVSGHMDGGLRFWDLRSGERTADISGTKRAKDP